MENRYTLFFSDFQRFQALFSGNQINVTGISSGTLAVGQSITGTARYPPNARSFLLLYLSFLKRPTTLSQSINDYCQQWYCDSDQHDKRRIRLYSASFDYCC
jgi:hypothetical protein